VRPRPVILFVFAYGAGLSTGLLRFGDPAGVSLALLALGFWGRSHLLGLLAAAALVGRLSGDLARERERIESSWSGCWRSPPIPPAAARWFSLGEPAVVERSRPAGPRGIRSQPVPP